MPPALTKGSGLQALCPVPEHPGQRGDRHRRLGKRLPDAARRGAARFAMGNAIDDVKAASEYVMPDCDHDGVAEAIERFLLAQR